MEEWEDSHFYAAKYYDKLMTAFMGENRSAGKSKYLYSYHIVHSKIVKSLVVIYKKSIEIW